MINVESDSERTEGRCGASAAGAALQVSGVWDGTVQPRARHMAEDSNYRP
jgi:hypothetical protein